MSSGFSIVELVSEVTIEAPPSKVWKALTEQIDGWWPRTFCVDANATKAIRLELSLGGRMYEDWGGGQGLVWKTVTGFVREQWLMLSGELWSPFGGPAHEQLKIELVPKEKATTLRLATTLFGRADPDGGKGIEEGWKVLFGEHMRGFVERAGEK